MRESPLSAWTVDTFLIGTLVGTGGFWEWKKIELESQNQEIERAVKTTDLREKENEDNFTTLENKLAQLEGRQSRNIPIDFIPPTAPTNLRAVVH